MGTRIRPRARLLDWEKFAIADAYANGEKVEAIEAEFVCDRSRITRIAREFGLPTRYAGRRPLKEARGEEAS